MDDRDTIMPVLATNIVEEIGDRIQALVGDNPGEFNYACMLLGRQWKWVERVLAGEPCPPFDVEIQMSSQCNLNCRWCIGSSIQKRHQVTRLPDNITPGNIQAITDGIVTCKYDGLGVDTVKFSGFIGEPLMPGVRHATLMALATLKKHSINTGVFTNGVELTPDLWPILSDCNYVHLSLDAGPVSFAAVKGRNAYNRVLMNLREFCRRKGDCKVNVGYVIVPENIEDILQAVQDVTEAGADGIRFKVDVSDECFLSPAERDRAFELLGVCSERWPNVHVVHNRHCVDMGGYASWDVSLGCYYQHLCAAIGSDGNLYLCDFNTMPGSTPLGNVINQPFQEVWDSRRRKYLADGVSLLCRSPVCPPFGNAANAVMFKLNRLVRDYGREIVTEALGNLSC